MSYEYPVCLARPTQDSSTVTSGPHEDCRTSSAGARFPLCFVPNADVGRRAFEMTPTHQKFPSGEMVSTPADPVSRIDAPQAPAIHVSADRPAINAAERNTPPVEPSALHSSVLIGRAFVGPAGLAALAVSHFGLQGIIEGVRDLPGHILDKVNQSGGMVGVQCHVKQEGIGRFGGILLFELTPKDPATGERKFIVTVPIGGSLYNPIGPGAGSYRYSWSSSPERAGHNYSVSSEAVVRKTRTGGGFGNSAYQGETFSLWRENVFAFEVGPQLFRTDINRSVKGLPTGTQLQCGAAFMGTGPMAGLLGDPLFKGVRWMGEPARRTKDRLSNNRKEHPNEATFLEALASIYLN